MTTVYILPLNNYYDEKILNKISLRSHQKNPNERVLLSYYSWYMLYLLLLSNYDYDLTKENIFYNNDKPYSKNIYFNISHSQSLVAFIVSDHECAIDIECVNKRKDHKKISKRIFKKTFTILKFYKKWTLLETSFKYHEKKPKIKKSLILKHNESSNLYVLSYFANSKAKIYW